MNGSQSTTASFPSSVSMVAPLSCKIHSKTLLDDVLSTDHEDSVQGLLLCGLVSVSVSTTVSTTHFLAIILYKNEVLKPRIQTNSVT